MAKKKPAKRRKRATNATPKKRSAPDWAPAFVLALSRTANVRAASAAAGIDRTTVYRRRDSDGAFALQMAAALDDAVDDLELEARRRACEGLRRVKFHQGAPIMVPLVDADGRPVTDDAGEVVLVPYVEHEYSDTLMIFLLKAHRPEKYRENVKIDARVSGPPYKVYVGFDPDRV